MLEDDLSTSCIEFNRENRGAKSKREKEIWVLEDRVVRRGSGTFKAISYEVSMHR